MPDAGNIHGVNRVCVQADAGEVCCRSSGAERTTNADKGRHSSEAASVVIMVLPGLHHGMTIPEFGENLTPREFVNRWWTVTPT